MQLLDWMVFGIKTVALFIESIGKIELLDSDTYIAFSKAYYDKLFKHKGLKII